MAEASNFLATQRIAVVTGGNKGIGLEICRQLASKGVLVILTARDEKKGAKAIAVLKEGGLTNLIFHQLDVTNPTSIAQLKDFIKARFGKLDILVNNAGVFGVVIPKDDPTDQINVFTMRLMELGTQPYERAVDCIQTNYYGAKWMTQELLPLLHLSDSPRIVNVSSRGGILKNVGDEWAIQVLSDIENLTEDKLDSVANELLKDYREGLLESKKWPQVSPAYVVSKAGMNAYTRILAKKYPGFLVNCVCPGFVRTDINGHNGSLSAEEGAETPVWLALLPQGSPSGKFFANKEVVPF